jgi:2-(1,2-epoxy-1,2-dihydrophenyl)acetyl-CoA isomerase
MGDTSSSPPLLAVLDGAVLLLTLNRPETLNSLTPELLVALGRALHEDAAEPSVRAVVITGAGRGFCSGQDLAELPAHAGGIDVRARLTSDYLPVIRAMATLEKPVIAAVNGVAAGAGLALALGCDLRVAAETATFVQAFVRRGLVPDAGATYLLPRVVGLGRALELSLLGDPVSAADAERMGLVNRVVPDAELMPAALEMAARLAAGPRAVGLTKLLLRQSLDRTLAEQCAREADAQAEAVSTEDFAEGLAAFREKRPPRFRGR